MHTVADPRLVFSCQYLEGNVAHKAVRCTQAAVCGS